MGVQAMAVPTTLSGAEMTRVHRRAAGSPPGTPGVRPAVVVNDPALSASQPPGELAASASNALGHAVEAPCTVRASPISTLAAHDAARRLVWAFDRPEPNRDALALGALLAAYAMDSTGYGLHHVLSQTLVRVGGAGHGPANAVMLPHSIGALAWRCPDRMQALAEAMGRDPADAARALAERAGAKSLRAVGVDPARLPEIASAAAERADLDATPPRASRAEILSLYEHAL
jgi:alcohol dehydrogenase class IV